MKKFLSLVLALVMTMSLVTISAGAKDFTDDDKVTYEEAVNVISEIGVVDGYTDGSFNPQGSLTRGAAAKIICNMILGPTTAAELHADTAPYKDVPTNHTFAGYIAYCAKEGIISGYADGTFRPAGTLTGYAFMKMLLGALGYDASIEGYTGANWSINVAKQAINIGLNDSLEGDFNGVKAVNREEAALYAFNTLKADMVEYDTTISTTINGQTVTIGNSQAKAMEWKNSATRKTNIKNDNYIQFAEQYFTKLYLTEDYDVFGRPDREWEYDGKDLGTYVNYDLLVQEYTEEVTGLDLYSLLGKSTVEDYDTTVYIDGVSDAKVNSAVFTAADMNKNNKDGVGDTDDGVLTQVFVDTDDKEVTIAIINTYLAIADSDYNEKKEEASFDVYGLAKKTVNSGFEYVKTLTDNKEDVVKNVKASIDDFDVANVAEDDAYLACVADGEIQILEKAEVIEEAELTAFKLGSNVTADGTKYDYSATAEYDVEVLDNYTSTANGTNLKDDNYNIYLDKYGYLIGIDLVDEADNYVFITGIDNDYSYLSNKNVDAAGIFTDGTMETIRIDTSKSDLDLPTGTNNATVNAWYTYTVNNSGVYTVKRVADLIDKDAKVKKAQSADEDYTTVIDKKNIALPGNALRDGSYARVYGNDDTVYLTASIDTIRISGAHRAVIIDDVDSVTVGIKNANIEPWSEAEAKAEMKVTAADTDVVTVSSGVYPLYKDNGYIIAVVVVGEDAAASKNLVYVNSKNVEQESYDKTADEWTWSRKVIYNGEEIELIEKGDSLTYIGNASAREGEFTRYNWYQVQLNANGEVIGVKDAITALDDSKAIAGQPTAYEYLNGATGRDIDNIQSSINEYDTVLFEDRYVGDKMTMKGSTLYVTTTSTQGFFVAEDAKIVLIQTNKNKEETEFYTGADELEDIVDNLNEKNGGGYDYYVGAILEDGAATTVVVYDYTNNYDAPEIVNSDIFVNLSDPDDVKVNYTGNEPSTDDILVAIEAALKDEGYTVTKKTITSGKYVFSAENDKTGFSTDFTYGGTLAEVYEQPSKREELEDIYNEFAGYEKWAELPAVGVEQTVKDGVIYLSGNLDVITEDNFDDYAEGIKQWCGQDTWDSFIAARAAVDSSISELEEFAFFYYGYNDGEDDYQGVACVFNVDGKPSVFRTASGLVGSTLDLGAVVYDVSGLRF